MSGLCQRRKGAYDTRGPWPLALAVLAGVPAGAPSQAQAAIIEAADSPNSGMASRIGHLVNVDLFGIALGEACQAARV